MYIDCNYISIFGGGGAFRDDFVFNNYCHTYKTVYLYDRTRLISMTAF